ncbi:MAG: hypothetical protein H0W04_08875 [Chthoniobacterales bacterium]|nr:hypothetical protein [Chthoniobacterales bacterium]
MRGVFRFAILLSLSGVLSKCTPALYMHLYNSTDEVITLSKTESKEVVTISPNTAADFSPMFLPGEQLLIQTPRHKWTYSLRNLFVPQSLYQQHLGVMRSFGRIDSRGRIFILAPPHEAGPPQEITQPTGFPVQPRTET